MEGQVLLQPGLVGRAEELGKLSRALAGAIGGNGSTLLISGEAGIGKTRLVSEILTMAEAEGAAVIRGWCLPESLEPLMPVREALRGCGMEALVSGAPPPRTLSGYLLNDAGMLYARAERTKTDMDADIFAAMLRAVSSFVTDSLKMMGQTDGKGDFSSISHSGYRILVQSRGRFSLAIVVEGSENEFLIDDMKKILAEAEDKCDPKLVAPAGYGWLEEKLMKLVTSPRYDGAFVMDDPRLRQENLHDNILLGLQRAAASAPVILFLDDLQWADPSTLGLLHYLARNTRADRMLILGTYRPEDVMQKPDGSAHALETAMQDMSRESLFTDIRLNRLGPEDTGGMVMKALDCGGFPEELRDRIHAETDGNPFFVLEVLRLLVDEGFIRREGGDWGMGKPLDELHLPSKIIDIIRRRLNRLLKAQYEILECASVVGERFGSDVVGLTLGMGRIPLLKNLNEIEKTHRLIHSRESKYQFDHCKIRDVLYDNINEELRAEYHRTVAQSYEELFRGREADIAADIAHHYLEAGDPRASRYFVLAADRAREGYANGEAVRFYSLALGFISDYAERARILEHLGEIHTIMGECDRAVRMFQEAVGITDDAAGKAELYGKMSRAFERHSEYDRGIEAARTGLEILGDGGGAVKLRLLGALSLNHVKKSEYDTALDILTGKLEDAERLDEKKEIADAHRLIGIIWWFRGDFEKALEHYQIALPIQRDIGDGRGMESTLNNIGVVYMEIGRLDEALRYFKEGLEYEEMVGDKSGQASGIDNIGNVLHTKGDAETALGYHLRGLELYRMNGDRNGEAWALSSLGYVYMDLDRTDESIECHLRSAEICRDIGDQHILIYDYYGLADSHRTVRKFEKALEYTELALSLADELGARREVGATTYIIATIKRDMGDFASATEKFADARNILAEVGDTTMLSMIDYDEGKCLGMSGDAEGAKILLEKARDAFAGFGMGIWLRKAEAALARLENARAG